MAAGARCRPVCPAPPPALEMSPRSTELVGGALAPTSAHLAIAQRSVPLELLVCSVSTPGRSLSDTVRLCPRPAAWAESSTRRPKHGDARIFRSQNIATFPRKVCTPSILAFCSSMALHRLSRGGCAACHGPSGVRAATMRGARYRMRQHRRTRTGSHLRPSPPFAPALRLRSAALPGAPLPHHTTQRLRRRLEFRRGRVRE